MPLAQSGWQMWQPPSYYFLVASFIRFGNMMGRSTEFLLSDTQTISVLITIVTLAFGVWIGKILFPEKKEAASLYIFVGVLAVFPGLILFSSHISNDVLLLLISFLFFALVLHWWRYGGMKYWYGACFVLGLGLLTKSNAAPLLGILFVSLLLWRGIWWRRKILIISLSLLFLLSMTGWYYIARFVVEGETSMVGNQVSSLLALENSVYNFVVFNPVRVVSVPFNSNFDDSSGRDLFLEYFFRSSFFGEFNYGETMEPISKLLLILGIIALPFAYLGFCIDIKKGWYTNLPVWVSFFILIAAIIYFRLKNSFSCAQDFRYIPLIIVPITYYALKGLAIFSKSIVVIYGIIFISTCVVFTILLLAL
jgi:hypothetical protein